MTIDFIKNPPKAGDLYRTRGNHQVVYIGFNPTTFNADKYVFGNYTGASVYAVNSHGYYGNVEGNMLDIIGIWEEPKPAPTIESLQEEIAELRLKLNSILGDKQ